jgi:hypothetical protein
MATASELVRTQKDCVLAALNHGAYEDARNYLDAVLPWWTTAAGASVVIPALDEVQARASHQRNAEQLYL